MSRPGYGVAALAALWLLGCTEAAPAPSPAASAAVDHDADSDAAPIPSASASAVSELAALSGDKPPGPPPKPSSAGDARAEEMKRDSAQLDLAILSALSNGGRATDQVLSDSPPTGVLNDAAAGPRERGLSPGDGGATMGTGAGQAGGLGSRGAGKAGPSHGAGSKIGGKVAKDLTTSDLEKALASAGCTTTRLDSPSQPPSPGALIEAKCASKGFVVTFAPAGAARPDAKAIAEMDRLGSTWQDDGMLLAIVPGNGADCAAASELMNKLRASDAPPRANASVGGASLSGGSVSNAGAVVAGMAAGFRRCYQRGLAEDETMKGSVRVTAKIGPNGEVQSASPSEGGGLSNVVKGCVAGVVSSRTFAPPDGGSATIVIPVSFFPQ